MPPPNARNSSLPIHMELKAWVEIPGAKCLVTIPRDQLPMRENIASEAGWIIRKTIISKLSIQ